MIKTANEELRDEVLAELDDDPSVQSERIGVMAAQGVVTITGVVPTLAEKWATEDAVRRVKGVRAIIEDLRVDLPQTHVRDDADVARAISNILYWNSLLPSTIQVTVQNGWVTLNGQVEWQYQRQEAERAIRNVAGVCGITNAIAIAHAPAEKDVRREVQRLLHRDAQLDADGIDIRVDGSTVTLTGNVRTWFEREEASRAAWSVKGVCAVHNDITVF
ncbi:MAG TPA: BON domain-containing protein [Candidatus Baltobacteraceae bacterium]|jgi:osmotically-inducible protein OsmY|nr:BON domain-containing protein [Candidatus Baltobacteraceae bacterium]